eukprot:TRINITY_DN6005_c1_g1_i1.p1 TRINITY_DN6005_c1_g1~~TRINITY_DN6005_c1_g1_i1.p1  ORF type:complete len:288 (-),score=108.89 TRINITY_DN6005_c1_g1_i1:68-931(-)
MSKTIELKNGFKIPSLGFGCGTAWYKKEYGDIDKNLVKSIKTALKVGFRHIDAAEGYKTEPEIAIAIKESGLKREELFVTEKVYKSIQDPVKSLQDSLEKLGLKYVDLYLIHAPFFKDEKDGISIKEAWKGMEKALSLGLTKSIGVSNFYVPHLQELLSTAEVKPVVNQLENHPYLQANEVLKFCKENGIQTEAYSPLISLVHKKEGPVDSVVEGIAKKRGKTSAQILLNWSLKRGNVVITTSSNEERMKEYLDCQSFELDDEEMKAIEEAGSKLHFRKYWSNNFKD